MRDWNRQRKSSVMASVVGHQSAAHEFLFFFSISPLLVWRSLLLLGLVGAQNLRFSPPNISVVSVASHHGLTRWRLA